MPFGLANSPIVYQRIINDTLRSLIDEGNVLVYVDDVLLLSNSVSKGITFTKGFTNPNASRVFYKLTEMFISRE